MENQEQFAPLLDSIFSPLEASGQFEIRCTTVQERKNSAKPENPQKKTTSAKPENLQESTLPTWPTNLVINSVNGASSLKQFQAEMITHHMMLIMRFMEAFNKVLPAMRPQFFKVAVEEARRFIETHQLLVEVFPVIDAKNGQNPDFRCTCFFTQAHCIVDGAETEDPLVILQVLIKTNLYARAWYKLIKSVSALLSCACCQGLPNLLEISNCNIPEVKGCKVEGSKSQTCPVQFVDSMALIFEEHEIALAEEKGEPPEARLAELRAQIMREYKRGVIM